MANRDSNTPRGARDQKPSRINTSSIPHALRKVVRILGIARNAGGDRTGIAVQSRTRPKRLRILGIGLTAPQSKSGLIDWALKNEFDALLEVGANSLGPAMREAAACKTIVVVDTPGYHRIMVGDVPLAAYAWGGRVYFLGTRPDFKVYATDAAAEPLAHEGKWAEWIEAIEPVGKVNPRLLAAMCVSLSAALLRAFGAPSFTLALWAPTTKGKSTIQLVCSAFTGLPKVLQWNGTAIGIQDVLGDSPDQPRCLDDTHKAAKAEDVAQLVMATGNGSARLISKRSSGSQQPREMHSSPILSSEKSLASTVGNTAAAGMFARYFEIGQGLYGMFDDLCGHANGAALSHYLKSAIKGQYGTVWPRWLKLLDRSWPKVEALHNEKLPDLRAAILTKARVSELDDVTSRVLDNLAFAAFAGVVATKLGLWDISSNRISAAFGLLLREHLDRTPTGNALVARIVETIGGFLETHGDKFPATSVANDPDRAGHMGYLVEDDKHHTLYLFIPSVFRALFVKQFGEEVYEALRAADYLVCHGSRHNRFTKRVPAGPDGERKPMDFIAIKASIRYAPPLK